MRFLRKTQEINAHKDVIALLTCVRDGAACKNLKTYLSRAGKEIRNKTEKKAHSYLCRRQQTAKI